VSALLGVGLMSGTSLDGVSAALVRLTDSPLAADLVAFHQDAYTPNERGQIVAAIARGGARDLALLHVSLGERFAAAVLALLAEAHVGASDVAFVASHGQTIWHEPGRVSLQLGDPAVVAERVGVRVVSDFRARDVAAGGQGAPLVPLADVLLFGAPDQGRVLVNIGGIANLTWVPRRGVTEGVVAFDSGPGVAVIDAIARRLDPAAPYDRDGAGARRGRVVPQALGRALEHPFLAAVPPKSTGREVFGETFADELLAWVEAAGGSGADALATATALTAETLGRAVETWTPAQANDTVVLSGGGVRNAALVAAVAARCRPRSIALFDDLFFNAEAKEALVFAFLGYLTLSGQPGNLPAATGARGPRVLGRVTPA
jgi:anhydro-N-acetylmuramic acid kinase